MHMSTLGGPVGVRKFPQVRGPQLMTRTFVGEEPFYLNKSKGGFSFICDVLYNLQPIFLSTGDNTLDNSPSPVIQYTGQFLLRCYNFGVAVFITYCFKPTYMPPRQCIFPHEFIPGQYFRNFRISA